MTAKYEEETILVTKKGMFCLNNFRNKTLMIYIYIYIYIYMSVCAVCVRVCVASWFDTTMHKTRN